MKKLAIRSFRRSKNFHILGLERLRDIAKLYFLKLRLPENYDLKFVEQNDEMNYLNFIINAKKMFFNKLEKYAVIYDMENYRLIYRQVYVIITVSETYFT